jgi:hypothetical protein
VEPPGPILLHAAELTRLLSFPKEGLKQELVREELRNNVTRIRQLLRAATLGRVWEFLRFLSSYWQLLTVRTPMGNTSNWITVAESSFPWERDALNFVREQFPSHEPYRAWSNFEFIAEDGSINEVDLLVFTPQGFFLIEIKSRAGVDKHMLILRINDLNLTEQSRKLSLSRRKGIICGMISTSCGRVCRACIIGCSTFSTALWQQWSLMAR